MTQRSPTSGAHPRSSGFRSILHWVRTSFLSTIRNKIILPFLFLTLIVAMLGTYVVTRLVAASMQDRLTNQLLETSRAASDSVVDWEQRHLSILRQIVFTIGVPEAIQAHEGQELTVSLIALAANYDVHMLFGVDKNGEVVAFVRRDGLAYETDLFVGQDMSSMPMVGPVLRGEQDDYGDKYAGTIEIDGEVLLLTVAPAYDQSGTLVGAVGIGTPFEQILETTKANVLADLTLYQEDGKALQTTFVLAGGTELSDLDVTPAVYQDAWQGSEHDTPLGEAIVNRRSYQTAYVPLKIRRDTLGVLGVSWPSTIITSLITTNRNGLSIVFSIVAMLVVLVGYGIAQNLTTPIRRLAETAEAVSKGDLTQRSGVATLDEIGRLGHIFDDMTLKLNAQTQALRLAFQEQEKEAAFLSAIIASAVDGTVVMSRDGTILRQNPVAQQIVMSNQPMWMGIFAELVEKVLIGERAHRGIELRNQWIEALAAPVVTASGEEVGIVITLRDVTEQVLTERLRSSFLLQMSHELYTPLTTFKGYVELANTMLGDEAPRIRHFLGQAVESARTLNQMISQMLDVAGMIRGSFEIRPHPVDITAIVETAADRYRSQIEKKGLSLHINYGPLTSYEYDGERLRWALEHLLKNACDYTMSGGEISLYAGNEGDFCILRVRDTGVGIAPKDRPRLFEQFYRGYPVAPDGTVIDVRGTGLGLFITREIIQAHGGEIKVYSRAGSGSEFVITLPLHIDEGSTRRTARKTDGRKRKS